MDTDKGVRIIQYMLCSKPVVLNRFPAQEPHWQKQIFASATLQKANFLPLFILICLFIYSFQVGLKRARPTHKGAAYVALELGWHAADDRTLIHKRLDLDLSSKTWDLTWTSHLWDEQVIFHIKDPNLVHIRATDPQSMWFLSLWLKCENITQWM